MRVPTAPLPDFWYFDERGAVSVATQRAAPRRRLAGRASLRLGELVLARPRCGDSRRAGAFSCVNFVPSSRRSLHQGARAPLSTAGSQKEKASPPPLATGALTLVRLRLVTHDPERASLVPPPSPSLPSPSGRAAPSLASRPFPPFSDTRRCCRSPRDYSSRRDHGRSVRVSSLRRLARWRASFCLLVPAFVSVLSLSHRY